jgi:Ca-activated chloride channel homolog
MPSRSRLRFVLLSTVLSVVASGHFSVAAAQESTEKAAPELAERHARFLDEAAILLSPLERAALLLLARDYQRDAFIRRFWQVRDPFPQTGRNELQEAWSERAEQARQKFGNLTEDRARMLLLNGAPTEVIESRCGDLLLPLEIWPYAGTDKIRGSFALVFVGAGKARRLWAPTQGIGFLLAPGATISAGVTQIRQEEIIESCPQGDKILTYLSQAVDWNLVVEKFPVIPKPGEEWLRTFLSRTTEVAEGAAPISARLDVRFPSRRQSRTVVQGQLSVPRVEAGLAKVGERASFDFLVDGEVLRGEDLFEQFRYQFSLPEADAKSTEIPLLFERTLRPGNYRLILRLEDRASGKQLRLEHELVVPSVADVVAEAVAAAPPGSANGPASANDALAEANAAIPADEHTVRLLPPSPGLKTGTTRVEAMTTGEGIAKVVFELDGRPMLSKSKPPFSVDLPLGIQPRTHTVVVRALGPAGEKLAEDELLLNAGPHRFSARLVEPQAGKLYRSSLRAQVEVEVPQDQALDRVELYLNDDLVATLFQPPFVQPMLLPAGGQITYVRAVAYLTDGLSTEDLVLVNAPENAASIDVDLVELYATVVDRKGRPVDGLTREDFRVQEDKKPQDLVRFERVTDVPIFAGIVLDTSGSMTEELPEAVRGALSFFETVIKPKDRAMVLTFSDQPRLAVPFTNEPTVLAGGLANLIADGGTALHDSIIQALYYFGGLKGKRALIVLTDGRDEGSRYPFNDALEYAKRSGVAIYTIGLALSTRDADQRIKLQRLAAETGGQAFFIERAGGLVDVYEEIEAELRTQYYLAYQSSGTGDSYRSIEVEMAKPGLEAKTVSGYYP